MPRIRRVDDKENMEQLVEDFMTRGYKIKDKGQGATMLKKKTWGSGGMHLIVALFTIWWTLGLGNVLYAAYKYLTAEEVQVKIDE